MWTLGALVVSYPVKSGRGEGSSRHKSWSLEVMTRLSQKMFVECRCCQTLSFREQQTTQIDQRLLRIRWNPIGPANMPGEGLDISIGKGTTCELKAGGSYMPKAQYLVPTWETWMIPRAMPISRKILDDPKSLELATHYKEWFAKRIFPPGDSIPEMVW